RAILGYRVPDPPTEQQRLDHQFPHSAPGDDQVAPTIATDMAKRIVKGSTNYVRDWLEVNRPHRYIGGINAAGMDATGYYWQEDTTGDPLVRSKPADAP